MLTESLLLKELLANKAYQLNFLFEGCIHFHCTSFYTSMLGLDIRQFDWRTFKPFRHNSVVDVYADTLVDILKFLQFLVRAGRYHRTWKIHGNVRARLMLRRNLETVILMDWLTTLTKKLRHHKFWIFECLKKYFIRLRIKFLCRHKGVKKYYKL